MLTEHSNLETMSENDILREFRNALTSLYPILVRLECLGNESQPHDDFEEIAESLWKVLVCKSLAWKYSLDNVPELGRYGFDEKGKDGYMEISNTATGSKMRFIEFTGCRDFSESPFNAIACVDSTGTRNTIEFGANLTFRWNRN